MTAVVNGMEVKTFQLPCFPTSWGVIHAYVTALPLKAGANNSIKVFSRKGDAADFDAISVNPPGGPVGPVPEPGGAAPPKMPPPPAKGADAAAAHD
jgi:hypothetical protein